MLKKIFPLIFIVFFISLFSYFNGEEFFEHSKQVRQQKNTQNIVHRKIENFGLSAIRELEKTDFYVTPNKKLLSIIVQKINSAQKKVYIEVYLLTEKRIKTAIIKAYKKGLEVKVLLEHSPYRAVNLNKKHFKQLEDAGVNIAWSDPKNYALNHSKIMIIDDELILSTGNFSYSTFAHNRDFFLITQDKKILNIFMQIFLQDFSGIKKYIYNDSIVLSPDDSRAKFGILFQEATTSIQMYAQYLKDDDLLRILKKQAESGIKIEIILSKNGYKEYIEKNEIHKNNFSKKGKQNFIVSAINKNHKMHAKAILIDGKYLFIGSVNFSYYSVDKNREMGLLLKNKNIISEFIKIFQQDQ